MPHVTGDRVKDTTTTTGTGNITVSGSAPTGFRTLSAVATANNDTLFLAIVGGAEWEVCLATRVSANEYARTTVLASSNSGSAVNFSAGTKDVFVTLPASKIADNTAYASSWDGDTATAPSKNAVYDKIEAQTSTYPTGLYARRVQEHYLDFTDQQGVANAALVSGGRWVTALFNTGSATRVNAGSGRPALRSTRTSSNWIYAINAASSNITIQDIDGLTEARFKMRVALRANSSAAPDATDDYAFYCGYFDSLSASGHTGSGDCALFAYYQSAGSALFQARSRRASGSFEATNLTLPSASTFQTLEVIVTSSSVVFNVDGSTVATHTTVPDGDVADGFRHQSNAGTASRSIDVLYMASRLTWASDV